MFYTEAGKAMTDLAELNAIDLLAQYRSGAASPVEATAATQAKPSKAATTAAPRRLVCASEERLLVCAFAGTSISIGSMIGMIAQSGTVGRVESKEGNEGGCCTQIGPPK